jgi:hypothetical protein
MTNSFRENGFGNKANKANDRIIKLVFAQTKSRKDFYLHGNSAVKRGAGGRAKYGKVAQSMA